MHARDYKQVFADPATALKQPVMETRFYPWKVQRPVPQISVLPEALEPVPTPVVMSQQTTSTQNTGIHGCKITTIWTKNVLTQETNSVQKPPPLTQLEELRSELSEPKAKVPEATATSSSSQQTARFQVSEPGLVSALHQMKEQFMQASSGFERSMRRFVNPHSAKPSTSAAVLQEDKGRTCKSLIRRQISGIDFYVEALNGYISSDKLNANWETVEACANVQELLRIVRSRFFSAVPKISRYFAVWSSFVDPFSFKVDFKYASIMLNSKTLQTCSRGRLLSAVIHALIHCSVSLFNLS